MAVKVAPAGLCETSAKPSKGLWAWGVCWVPRWGRTFHFRMRTASPPEPRACSVAAPSRRRAATLAAAIALVSTAACSKPSAWGEATSLILVASDETWAEVEDSTYVVLEPTIVTTREEKKFQVTQVDPASPELQDLIVFRQVIVLGPPDSPLVRAAADQAGITPEAPSTFTAMDVWARGQLVTIVVAEPGREADTWLRLLPDMIDVIDERYRAWVLERMFVSGMDSLVADSLGARFGFSIQIPKVYRFVIREGPRDTVVILRNDNPDPSELIRSILITWRPRLLEISEEVALDWRAAIDSVHYNVPQRVEPSGNEPQALRISGQDGLEVTGTWVDEGTFPAAGPYIDWLVQCPDKTVFIDAWLYAPRKPKYEYMIQLEQILGSFTCPAGSAASP